ncbi:response regulator [Candidatus Peregrinibacteria bacterium]|nr:response regulator [Candidatus Peregrinibacteria bacterium]
MSHSLKRILIVEDDPFILKILNRNLKSEFEIDSAVTGVEALQKIHKGDYSLILLDLVMPEMGGFEVLEQLQQEKIKIPIVVFSNLAQDEEKERALALGAKAYFVKSDTDIDQVAELIRRGIANKL